MTIRSLIFDLGGVLVIDRPEESLRRFDRLGFPEARGLLSPYPREGLFPDLEEGRITREDFCRIVRERYGHRLTIGQVTWALVGYAGEAEEQKLHYLRQLRPDYRLFLATNTNPFLYHYYLSDRFLRDGTPLDHFFDRCYASHLLHLRKPDLRFYRQILEENGLAPEETLYLDDREGNIRAAASLGIRTLRTTNGEDWWDEVLLILQKNP